MDSDDTYYAALGVGPEASAAEIRRAYLGLVKKWHPDRYQQDPQICRLATLKLQKINDAFRVLNARAAKGGRTESTDSQNREPRPGRHERSRNAEEQARRAAPGEPQSEAKPKAKRPTEPPRFVSVADGPSVGRIRALVFVLTALVPIPLIVSALGFTTRPEVVPTSASAPGRTAVLAPGPSAEREVYGAGGTSAEPTSSKPAAPVVPDRERPAYESRSYEPGTRYERSTIGRLVSVAVGSDSTSATSPGSGSRRPPEHCRLSATYTGVYRFAPAESRRAVTEWIGRIGGSVGSPGSYALELLVRENGNEYWLPVEGGLISYLQESHDVGDNVTLYARLVENPRRDTSSRPVIVVEAFG